jgi:two-component system LytT family sensor kinase
MLRQRALGAANIVSVMDGSRRTYLSLREVNWRIVLAFFGAVLVCLFFYRQLDYVANGEHRSALLTFSEEAVGVLAGLAVFPFVYLVAIRFPLVSPSWRRNLLAHLAGLCLISLVHTTLIAALRGLLFPLLGFHQSYGYMPWRYPMEFSHLFIFYWVGVSLIYLFHEVRFARERELREAKLEASLSEAQLQNLRLQLDPHFLFNALNAISATLYESPRAADEMIGRLGDLLRQLLKSDRSQEIPLAREIELLQLYTRIMEARLENRLKFTIEIEPAVKQALVPQLILQPLIENAIRHGMHPVTFQVDIVLKAHRKNDTLYLVVQDRGPGIDPTATSKTGIGLRNTRERLARLYDGEHSFGIRNASDGGAIVEIRLPFRAAAGSGQLPTSELVAAPERALT